MAAFDFSVLGPLEVRADGVPISLGGPRQRALLAYLLVNANRVVSADSLVDELWESPPRDGTAALQNQVSRLRKVLGDRLVTKAPGYFVRVEPGEIDLDRFRALVADAGAAPHAAERSRLLREADAIFRGVPFAEVDAPFAVAEADALEELRLAAVEARIDADLERCRHAELVPELGGLVARHPLRERLRRQLILALYRSDRQAEALEAYRETHRMLDEQLGLEPSPALRELERAILRHDPALTVEAVAARESEPSPRRRRALVVAAAAALLAFGGAAVAAAMIFGRSSPQQPAPVAAPPRVVVHHTHAPAKPVVVSHRHRSAPKAPTQVRGSQPPPQVIVTVVKQPAAAATTTAKPVIARKPPPAPKVSKPATAPPQSGVVLPSPPSSWTTLSDDFSGTTPDPTLWTTWSDGTGSSYAFVDGHLELSIPANAQTGGTYDMVGADFGTQCRFDGDFDARVDYHLLDWPAAAGGHAQLSGFAFGGINSAVSRMVNQWGDQYSGNVNQQFNSVNTTDTNGTIRLVRSNDVLTSYYLLPGGKWASVYAGSAPGRTMVGLQLFAMATEWLHVPIRVAFDNFSVSAPSMICP